MHSKRRNSGFVLLMALAILVIAGTVLAATARRSCRGALEAGEAMARLQRRWGALSLRAAVVPLAEEMLNEAAVLRGEPVNWASHSIRLGGVTFHLVVGDEQAKANVNLIAQRRGDRTVGSSVLSLQSGLARALHVVPRPDGPVAGSRAIMLPNLYGSFDQLFEFDHPSELFERDSLRPGAAGRITCWGSGRVNFRRAGRTALREVLAGSLDESDVAKILAFRREQPDGTLYELLRHLDLTGKKAQSAGELLTDVSHCRSLWIIAEGRTRRWYRLYVDQAGDMQNDLGQWIYRW